MKHIEFIEAPHIRRVTIDPYGHLYEVTNLYDQFAEDTNDPGIAVSCVINIGNGQWVSGLVEDYPVYTVH